MEVQRALDLIREFEKNEGRSPSYSDLAKIWNYRSKKAAHALAHKLISLNLLRKDSRGHLCPLLPNYPLFGVIKAGIPIREEESREEFDVLNYLNAQKGNCFFLRVSGDSMIEAGILSGDLVLVDRDRHPHPGDIVVAEIDSEHTLKYFQSSPSPHLLPANTSFDPLFPQENLSIQGVVVSMIRAY